MVTLKNVNKRKFKVYVKAAIPSQAQLQQPHSPKWTEAV